MFVPTFGRLQFLFPLLELLSRSALVRYTYPYSTWHELRTLKGGARKERWRKERYCTTTTPFSRTFIRPVDAGIQDIVPSVRTLMFRSTRNQCGIALQFLPSCVSTAHLSLLSRSHYPDRCDFPCTPSQLDRSQNPRDIYREEHDSAALGYGMCQAAKENRNSRQTLLIEILTDLILDYYSTEYCL
jgi:hypothetical protein